MTPRQRVLKTVSFEEPDRVPIDLGTMRASGINAVVYGKPKRRMGIMTPTKVFDTMRILAEAQLQVLERLHADVVPLNVGSVSWSEKKAAVGAGPIACGPSGRSSQP